MNIRNLFKRRQTTSIEDTNIPPEVQAYTQAEHRDRMGKAWLIGVLSLIITVLFLMGIFFGGRWVYQKITGNNATTNTETQTPAEDNSSTEKSKSDDQASQTPNESPTQSETPSTSSNPQSNPTQQPTQSTNPQASQTPAIPRTGPDSDE